MAAIEIKDVQQVLDQINLYKTMIKQAGEEGRARMDGIRVDEICSKITLAEGRVNTDIWSKLPEKDQSDLYKKLTLVCDALIDIAGLDGPTDPGHIMRDEYASSVSVVLCTLLGFFLTAALLAVIIGYWGEATGTELTKKIETVDATSKLLKDAAEKTNKAMQALMEAENTQRQAAVKKDKKKSEEAQKVVEQLRQGLETAKSAQGKIEKEARDAIMANSKSEVTEKTVLMMVILLGALGGSLHLVSSLVIFIGNRKLKRSWIPYYLAMPFTGAGLAPIIYMLLRVGLISPSSTAGNGSGLASLNLIAIYAFAVMSGLFSRVALDKLSEVFRTAFSKSTTPPSADTLTAQKSKEGGEATP